MTPMTDWCGAWASALMINNVVSEPLLIARSASANARTSLEASSWRSIA